ncbi:MAG: DMT family transporter [Paracoccaceae bacterium]
MPQPTARDWLSIVTLGVIWGATFMVVTLALEGYGPVTVACARTAIGALVLSVIAKAAGSRALPRPERRLMAHIVAIGILSTALPFFLLSWGQQSVPSAFAGLSMAAVPLFVLPLAHFAVAGEALTRRKAVGFLIGFVGTAILIGPDALRGDAATLPRLACIGAALCYAVSSVIVRRCPPIDPLTLAASSLIVGSAVMIPAMLMTEGVPQPAAPRTMIAILVLGAVPTAFATLLRISVIRSAGPSFLTLVNYQVPPWSLAFGALVLGEALPGRFFAALALILAGLAISQAARRDRIVSAKRSNR